MRVSYVSALLGLLKTATEGKLSFATVDVSPLVGEPGGVISTYKDTTIYVSSPKSPSLDCGESVLFLTDMFGVQLLENKLLAASLADSFAQAGYLMVMPDLFNGKPASSDIDNLSDFNTT
ncbi:hypothetical protein MGN70_003368 [Eutypa lata]|nr:hypothetical protein MGN70_003368 [Eutypa lata]